MTRAEEAAAFAYVTNPNLAKDIHRPDWARLSLFQTAPAGRLMRAQSWPALFAELPDMHVVDAGATECVVRKLETAACPPPPRHGRTVKALVIYVQQVEQAYAAKRTLYRGMRLPEYHITDNYVVGRVVTWHAFASVTTDRQLAESYSRQDCDRGLFGSEGVPVLFVIQTFAGRGAALPGNSELLLAPFTYFEVTSVERLALCVRDSGVAHHLALRAVRALQQDPGLSAFKQAA